MKRVIALGFFDGVHVGHGALLRLARERADELGCSPVALTFDPHPDQVIFGEKTPLLNTLEQRRMLMTDLYGMEEMLVLPFDRAVMEMDWQDFVKTVLVEQFEAVHLVCGYDYTFGYRGLGNAQSLQELCRELGLGCDVVDKVELLGEEVSSTRIRRLLEQGDPETANALLGHRHFFTGTVIHGKRLGHRLGFPTANMNWRPEILVPAHGVYGATVTLPGGKTCKAITNIGVRPTVDREKTVTAESWLLDFDGDLYGKEIKVELWKFLRPERKFSCVEELRQAVQQDGEAARQYFKET